MSPLRREALMWIGGAVLVALVIFVYVALTMPELDSLTNRYSVL